MNKSPHQKDQSASPRPVSRGAKLQTGFLGLDSLYLVIEYPHLDTFNLWSQVVPDLSDKRLYAGLPFEDYVLKKGAHGYKVSVWDGDARLYLTDHVDEKLQQSGSTQRGMGLLLQLGPKWLRKYGDVALPHRLIENVYAQFIVFGVRDPKRYPVRLNRLDIALDVLGLRVPDFSIDQWRREWVGYAQQRHFHDSSLTGELQGLSIGSSEGVIRFKVYDKLPETVKSGTSTFWRSVWGISEDEPIDVARFEWTIKAYEGRFTQLRYLNDFTFTGFLDLLNYASLKWGRLCVPGTDKNSARRELSRLWANIRRLVDEWSMDHEGLASRQYDYSPDLSPAYVHSVAGWLAGFMARVGIHEDLDSHASLGAALDVLADYDIALLRKAEDKWAVLSVLAGKAKQS